MSTINSRKRHAFNTLQSRIDHLEAKLEAARAEAFAYGRCCELYQDSLGQFHCHNCGQRTFAMLQAVQTILSDGTETAMSHKESVRIALIRKTAPETIDRLKAEKAELVETGKYAYQWANSIDEAIERSAMADKPVIFISNEAARGLRDYLLKLDAALTKAEPDILAAIAKAEQRNPKPEVQNENSI